MAAWAISNAGALDLAATGLFFFFMQLISMMLKAGLIESTWQESPVGPPRKYYRLTGAGRAAHSAQHDAWVAIRDGLDALLKESR